MNAKDIAWADNSTLLEAQPFACREDANSFNMSSSLNSMGIIHILLQVCVHVSVKMPQQMYCECCLQICKYVTFISLAYKRVTDVLTVNSIESFLKLLELGH